MKEMADLRVRSAITLEECRCVLLKHADLKILKLRLGRTVGLRSLMNAMQEI